jgi:cytochrome oxidase assembly protein ShyY1
MPEKEYNVYHRFRPYFILGQLDHSKEILIPKDHPDTGASGYEVINPLYCYEGGKNSFKELFAGNPTTKVDRSAIIVNRGWIPAHLRDKRNRPTTELNSRQLVKVKGVFRRGKDVHDYKVPNNPNSNEWNNLSLEDIGIFWDLPNFDEQKYYYFQALEFNEDRSNDF